MIASFKPYDLLVKNTCFRNPTTYFELALDQRYIIPHSLTKPRIGDSVNLIDVIHADFKKYKYSLRNLADLFNELDLSYALTHKQVYFERLLPYSADLYNTFVTILPKDKFIPV